MTWSLTFYVFGSYALKNVPTLELYSNITSYISYPGAHPNQKLLADFALVVFPSRNELHKHKKVLPHTILVFPLRTKVKQVRLLVEQCRELQINHWVLRHVELATSVLAY